MHAIRHIAEMEFLRSPKKRKNPHKSSRDYAAVGNPWERMWRIAYMPPTLSTVRSGARLRSRPPLWLRGFLVVLRVRLPMVKSWQLTTAGPASPAEGGPHLLDA